VSPAAAQGMTGPVGAPGPGLMGPAAPGPDPAGPPDPTPGPGPKTVGAARGETVQLDCAVDADPPAISYRWKVNSSGETLDVPTERLGNRFNGSASVLRYTPTTEHDFGTLMCWAENAVGVQQEPCVFNVVSASKSVTSTIADFIGLVSHHSVSR